MIHIESLGNKIWLKGRNQDSSVYEITITDFKPYFYALSSTPTDIKSITGEYVKRIDCVHPGIVSMKKKQYELSEPSMFGKAIAKIKNWQLQKAFDSLQKKYEKLQ